MLNGIGTYPVIGSIRPELVLGYGLFQPDGAAVASAYDGDLVDFFTATGDGAGNYLVQLDKRLKFPRTPLIMPAAICKNLTTNLFSVIQNGKWDNTNAKFTLSAIQAGAAFDVPNDANNWIGFHILMPTSGARR